MIFSNDIIKVGDNYILDAFSFIDDKREIPEYIECSIIKSVIKDLNIEYKKAQSIEQLIDLLPKDYLSSIKNKINKEMYVSREKTDYSSRYHVYLLYYLPINIFKIWKPLMDLLTTYKLKRNITVLDIGTGPGSVAIGMIEFYKILATTYNEQEFSIKFKLIDSQDKFLDHCKSIIDDIKKMIPINLKIEVEYQPMLINNNTKFSCNEQYDIISVSNFINSYEHNREFDVNKFLIDLKVTLKKDGSLIIIEPGNKEECIRLKEIRNNLYNKKEFGVFSPCVSVWCQKQEFSCKCFTTYNLSWKKPRIICLLHDIGLNKLKYKSYVSFSYLILRKDLSRKYITEINKLDYTMLSDIVNYEGQRINIKGILRFKSENNLMFSLCDGTIDSSVITVCINLKDKTTERNSKIISKINMGELIAIRAARILTVAKNRVELEIDEKTKIDVKY